MAGLIDDAPEGANAPEFTVTGISGAVKRAIEGAFGHVRVRGEIGRVSRPRSGHVYLDLKDERAVLSAVIWRGQAARLDLQPEEGMEVIATGRLTTFAGQSKYQLVIEHLAPAGQGALMAMLDKRRKALAAEGLFADGRKRPLPFLPEIVGVVTSPSGAVIRDILHRLSERFPRRVIVWPVAVQGARCAAEVAAAIRGFGALAPGGPVPRPDVVIVARGGGSIEDLWGFNEEEVVRAAADCPIPLISAVGHETDTTLIDLAADRRAPTPSAAAEMAVPVRLDLIARVDGLTARLSRAAAAAVEGRRLRLTDLARGLPRAEALVETPRQRLDWAGERLPAALRGAAREKRLALSEAGARLSPRLLAQRITDRGERLRWLAARIAPAHRRLRAARAERLADRAGRLDPARLARALARRRLELAGLMARLDPARARRGIDDRRGRLQRAALRLDTEMARRLGAERTRLAALERTRQSLGYTATLRRGFAVVRSGETLLTRRAAAARATEMEIEFADGRLRVARAPRGRHGGSGAPPAGQGSLF